MSDFIVSILAATDDLWTDENPRPRPSVLMQEYQDRRAYLTSDPNLGDWPDTYIVGAWEADTGLQVGQSYDTNDPPNVIGTPTHPLHSDYFDYIRPIGNTPEGSATGELDSIRWQGHAEEKFTEDDNRYPATTQPFRLAITRIEHTAPDPFPGWGWRVDMISDDPLRDITARAIGVYADPECTQYLYTTGAFIDDGSGNYYTECPTGQRTPDPDPVYFALLEGSVQEGYYTLAEGAGLTGALFWDNPQTAQGGIPLNYVLMTQYTNGVGGKSVDSNIRLDDSPEGYPVVQFRVGPDDRWRLFLDGNAQDTADPSITLRRFDNGETVTAGLIFNAGRYISGVEAGSYAVAQSLVGKYVLVDIQWA